MASCRYTSPRVVATVAGPAGPAGPAMPRYRPRWRRGPRAIVLHVVVTARPRPTRSRAQQIRALGLFAAVVLAVSMSTSSAAVAVCVAVAALFTDDPLRPVPLGIALVVAGLLSGASAWWAAPLTRRLTLRLIGRRG